jgi:hypothetical protein
MQCPRSPCPVSWKRQQASHLGTSATLPCKLRYISVNPAPVHTQQSHLPPIQSKKQVSRSIPIHNRPSIVAALTGPGAHRRSSSPPVKRPQGSSITYYTFTGAVGRQQPSFLV